MHRHGAEMLQMADAQCLQNIVDAGHLKKRHAIVGLRGTGIKVLDVGKFRAFLTSRLADAASCPASEFAPQQAKSEQATRERSFNSILGS